MSLFYVEAAAKAGMNASELVFAYGTLRRGGSNHCFLAEAQLQGCHLTAPVYTMLNLGPYPGVVQPGDTAVAGEVYRILPSALAMLDVLEDYPRTYNRTLIPTPWGRAWIYLYNPDDRPWPQIPGGDWVRR